MSFAAQAAEIVWEVHQLDPEETIKGFTQEEFAQHLFRRMAPVPVILHTCMIDCDDGSAYPAVFKTYEGAHRREVYELEEMGYSFCEAVGSIRVEVDASGSVVGDTDYTYIDENDNEQYES